MGFFLSRLQPSAVRRTDVIRNTQGGLTVLPLPRGEGRGEGEEGVRPIHVCET